MTVNEERFGQSNRNSPILMIATITSLIIGVGLFVRSDSFGQENRGNVRREPLRWEYNIVSCAHKNDVVRNIDWNETRTLVGRLGDEGWELVTSNIGLPGDVLIFKRPKVAAELPPAP